MRKAQSEGIGLAVIVILMILGFLVFFLFSPDNSESDPRRESSQMMLSQFGHVFLQSEVTYGDSNQCKRTIYALIEDVHARGITNLGCNDPTLPPAQDFLTSELNDALDETLGAWGYDAYFEITQNNVQKYFWPETTPPAQPPCQNNRLGVTRYDLAGNIIVEIALC